MEELNLEGIFWLDETPSDQVAGRLTFDPKNGAELDLIGSFHELRELFGEIKDPLRIHGIAGGKTLTLLDCLRTNMSIQMPGLARERYRVPFVLSGGQIGASQELAFDSVQLGLSYLDEWVWKPGTTVDFDSEEGTGRIKRISVTYTPPEKSVLTTDFGELELGFTHSFRPSPIAVTTLTQSCVLGVRFPERRSVREVLKVCTALQNLVTIGVDSPARIMNAWVSHPDLTDTLQNGETTQRNLQLYAPFHGSYSPGEPRSVHPLQMLFTFDDIDGLAGVANWLKTSAKFEIVIASLLSQSYLPVIYTDNRFLNIVIATEALERIRLGQQNLKLDDALERLAGDVGDVFRALVMDVKSWANEIVRIRVNNLVHPGLRGAAEGARMHWLAESLYFLVVLCLLRECGVPEGVLSKVQRNERFRNVSEQLEATK